MSSWFKENQAWTLEALEVNLLQTKLDLWFGSGPKNQEAGSDLDLCL